MYIIDKIEKKKRKAIILNETKFNARTGNT